MSDIELTTEQTDAGMSITRTLNSGRERMLIAALDLARKMKGVLDGPAANFAGLTPTQRLNEWRKRNGADALARFAELKTIYDYLLANAPDKVAGLLPANEACVVMLGDGEFEFRYMPLARVEGRLIPVFANEAEYQAYLANPPIVPPAP